MANLPTYGRNEAAVTSRKGEVDTLSPNVDFDGGMYLGASNAPGIGISTGVVIVPKTTDWTLEDQGENARTPQGTQHIGITGLAAGSATTATTYPVQVARYEVTPGVDDINDEAHFVAATQQAADGADVGDGTLNRTGATVEIGDVLWTVDPVA